MGHYHETQIQYVVDTKYPWMFRTAEQLRRKTRSRVKSFAGFAALNFLRQQGREPDQEEIDAIKREYLEILAGAKEDARGVNPATGVWTFLEVVSTNPLSLQKLTKYGDLSDSWTVGDVELIVTSGTGEVLELFDTYELDEISLMLSTRDDYEHIGMRFRQWVSRKKNLPGPVGLHGRAMSDKDMRKLEQEMGWGSTPVLCSPLPANQVGRGV